MIPAPPPPKKPIPSKPQITTTKIEAQLATILVKQHELIEMVSVLIPKP